MRKLIACVFSTRSTDARSREPRNSRMPDGHSPSSTGCTSGRSGEAARRR
jgi:hypothetical protein